MTEGKRVGYKHVKHSFVTYDSYDMRVHSLLLAVSKEEDRLRDTAKDMSDA